MRRNYEQDNRSLHLRRQYERPANHEVATLDPLQPDGVYRSQTRFGLYRWHITDPVRFQEDLRVTIQALLAFTGRYRLGGLWVAESAKQAFPTTARPGLSGNRLERIPCKAMGSIRGTRVFIQTLVEPHK